MLQLVKVWPVTDTVHQYCRLCCQICPNLKAFFIEIITQKNRLLSRVYNFSSLMSFKTMKFF